MSDIHDMAVDGHGRPLAYTPEEVRRIVMQMIDEGDILAIIVRVKDDLAVQVFGPPSQEMLDCLEQTTTAYRRVLRGES